MSLASRSFHGSVRVLAIGKAAPAMARGATIALGDQIIGGVVVCDHVEPIPDGSRLLVGGHPYPDHRSLRAGEALLGEARRGDHDHLLVLVSGGGSALAEVPRQELSISQVVATTRLLMDAGTPISDLNVVRRHLSDLKDGGVLRRARTPVTTLLISDVLDGPADQIASGPTLADGTTPADALGVLEASGSWSEVDPAVIDLLRNPVAATPAQQAHEWEVIVDRFTAMAGARERIGAAGLPVQSIDLALRGSAAQRAVAFVRECGGGITIATGETTVQVVGKGLGGRNQHAALAAAIEIDGKGSIAFAALGTDGIDGPTDAAGAIIDGLVAERLRSAGVNPAATLARCDSHPALDAAGALVRTGPTGTNVGDLWMVSRS
ncbi:MAG: glycerate kinase type-2 family protein [Acidimicrobiia bacterium]